MTDHSTAHDGDAAEKKPKALAMLSSERPRNLGWLPAGAMLFGDWGTSRLYVLGLAFLVAGRTSIWLVAMMSVLILSVGWAYTHVCRLYPDGGGVYTAGKRAARILGVIGALLLFADYTITASISSVEAFHYFGLSAAAQDVQQSRVSEAGKGRPELEETVYTLATPDEIAKGEAVAVASNRVMAPVGKDAVPKILEGAQLKAAQATAAATGSGGPKYILRRDLPDLDPGNDIRLPHGDAGGAPERLFTWPPSPGLCAILAIIAIGGFNLLGPKHTASFAVLSAIGMIAITLGVVGFALPQIHWSQVEWGTLLNPSGQFTLHHAFNFWEGFVYIVLALSGVEAIANLTGVMKKPIFGTARKSIWLVAGEVALFNLLLAVAMIALASPGAGPGGQVLSREGHTEDMLAYMAQVYIGPWGEWPVRIIAGALLLSATNTAVNGLLSITYIMSRDGEMPQIFQRLNSFGAPWFGAIVAAAVPAGILLFFHDLDSLAALYAIGVVAAVALNTAICVFHPRLKGKRRKIGFATLSIVLWLIWLTLAFTKLYALAFVAIVLAVGLTLRQLTQIAKKRRPKPTLLRQAILDQLTPDGMMRPKLLLATAGGTQMAGPAVETARDEGASLVVAFVREASLGFRQKAEERLTLDTDPAAEKMFTEFLALGHRHHVTIIPAYDTGMNTPEIIAETAALNGVEKVLIGSSRRGALHQIIKGSFQRRLESLLPPEIQVEVIDAPDAPAVEPAAATH